MKSDNVLTDLSKQYLKRNKSQGSVRDSSNNKIQYQPKQELTSQLSGILKHESNQTNQKFRRSSEIQTENKDHKDFKDEEVTKEFFERGGLTPTRGLMNCNAPLEGLNLTNYTHTSGNINVVCRFRPLNDKEKKQTKDVSSTDFVDDKNIVIKSQEESSGKESIHKFSFDKIFNPNNSQIDVYNYAGRPIVDSILEGFNGTIFAYGQTGSGKTFTMNGFLDNPEQEGLIPRIMKTVFDHIAQAPSEIEFAVKISMLEIYMEKIKDLLDSSKVNLNVREDQVKGIYIENLSEYYVTCDDEVMDYLKLGNETRSIAATNMNDKSSRSHSIVILTIHQNNVKDLNAKTGKLYLVDLAGSEKISKTGAEGLTLDEGKSINKSLTTLGMVINSLTDGKSTHVPYRDSKLTRVLQESLGGNSKTSLIITCSPSVYNEAETLSTLRFGLRAKKIKNTPKINKEETVAELKIVIDKLEKEIQGYKKKVVRLEKCLVNNGIKVPDDSYNSEAYTKAAEVDLSTKEGSNLSLENEIKKWKLECEESHIEISMLKDNQKKLEDTISKYEEGKEILDMTIIDLKTRIKEIEETSKKRDSIDIAAFDNINTYEELKEGINTKVDLFFNDSNIVSAATIDRFLVSQLSELSKARPNLSNLIQSYQVQCIINNAKEKDFDFEDALTKKQKEYIAKSLKQDSSFLSGSDIERNNAAADNVASPQAIEIAKKEKKTFEKEKKQILQAFAEKEEVIKKLEEMVKDYKARVRFFEKNVNPEERALVKKVIHLEKKLETTDLSLKQAMTEKTIAKIEFQVLEKKVKKRSEKIMSLDKEILELKEQNKVLCEKMANLQKYVHKAQASGNLVRMIKGGTALSNHHKTSSLNGLAKLSKEMKEDNESLKNLEDQYASVI